MAAAVVAAAALIAVANAGPARAAQNGQNPRFVLHVQRFEDARHGQPGGALGNGWHLRTVDRLLT
ncbi:hypothetical protein [Streptomyces sp. V3I7]|uniref:hypothetical protein n=1 Tax=Streptomyces sp. V3I7 TaxID=3042278 RepID=UPI0027D7BED5|nr:hypothetical protein [Streptomyces sp. V3I7]